MFFPQPPLHLHGEGGFSEIPFPDGSMTHLKSFESINDPLVTFIGLRLRVGVALRSLWHPRQATIGTLEVQTVRDRGVEGAEHGLEGGSIISGWNTQLFHEQFRCSILLFSL